MAAIPVVSDHFQFNKQTRIVSWYVPEKFKPGFVVYPTTWGEASVADFGWIYPYTSCATYVCPGPNNAHLTCIVPEPTCNTPIPVISTPNSTPNNKEVITRAISRDNKRPSLLHGGKYFGDVNVSVRTISGNIIRDELDNIIYSHTVSDEVPAGSTIDWVGFNNDHLVIEGPKSRYILEDPMKITIAANFYGSGDLYKKYFLDSRPCDCALTTVPCVEEMFTMQSADVPGAEFPDLRTLFGYNIWYRGNLITATPVVQGLDLDDYPARTSTCRGTALISLPPDPVFYGDINAETPTRNVQWLIAVTHVITDIREVTITTYIKPFSYVKNGNNPSAEVFNEDTYNSVRATSIAADILTEYAKWHEVSSEVVSIGLLYDSYGPVLFNKSGTEAVSCYGWGTSQLSVFSEDYTADMHKMETTGVFKYTVNLTGFGTTTDLSSSASIGINTTWRVNDSGTNIGEITDPGLVYDDYTYAAYKELDYTYIVAADYIGDEYVEASYEYNSRTDYATTITATEYVDPEGGGCTSGSTQWLTTITSNTQNTTIEATLQTPWNAYNLPTETIYVFGTGSEISACTLDTLGSSTFYILVDGYDHSSGTSTFTDSLDFTIKHIDLRSETLLYETILYNPDDDTVHEAYLHNNTGIDEIIWSNIIGFTTPDTDVPDYQQLDAEYDTPVGGPYIVNSNGSYVVITPQGHIIVSIINEQEGTVYNYSSEATELGISVHEYLGLDSATLLDQIALRGLCLI